METLQNSKFENPEKIEEIFGDWIVDPSSLKEKFINAKPYPFIKIDNFLNKELAEKLLQQFPIPNEKWHYYNNPIEVKWALDKIDDMPYLFSFVLEALSNPKVAGKLTELTGIEKLEHDPTLHGSGIHCHQKNGRLLTHLDYELNPNLFPLRERRLNLILFFNKNWKEEYNGDLQLWEPNMSKCTEKIYPSFNCGVIFRTNNNSWHGLPSQIKCPDNESRKSLAFYWVSPLTSKKKKEHYRLKARFVPIPGDPNYEKIKKLCDIRVNRRITKEDVLAVWPEWYNLEENRVPDAFIENL